MSIEIIVNKKRYNYPQWTDEVDILSLITNSDWKEFKKQIRKKGIDKYLNSILAKDGARFELVPPPCLTFHPLNHKSPNTIKVVILGQDPYPDGINAQGESFSVPYGVSIPSSLNNIYKNLKKFDHIKKIPKHGCLASWVAQGVFLINSAFTTRRGHKNYHQSDWNNFTNTLIQYLNDNCDGLIFLIWGGYAHGRVKNIDTKKHYLSISSHPSGLSAHKVYNQFPAFNDCDHFGKANKKLIKMGKKPILWDSLDLIDEIMKNNRQ